MQWKFNEFVISDDKEFFDINAIHAFLSNQSYWAKDRSKDSILKSIQGAECFGLFIINKQVGFARVITDGVTFAYLCDVYVLEEYRNHGVGNFFLECILNNPKFKEVNWLLKTTYSQTFYNRLGFSEISSKFGWMTKDPCQKQKINLENDSQGNKGV